MEIKKCKVALGKQKKKMNAEDCGVSLAVIAANDLIQ